MLELKNVVSLFDGMRKCFNVKHYLTRWTLIIGGYSIRLHHWLSDDVAAGRFYHNHSSNFISIVLFGKYWNVTPKFKTRNANEWIP